MLTLSKFLPLFLSIALIIKVIADLGIHKSREIVVRGALVNPTQLMADYCLIERVA